MRHVLVFTLGLLVWSSPLPAQNCRLWKDLNNTRTVHSGKPGGLVACAGSWYFAATTEDKGTELYKTNGTTCTFVKDIYPGPNSSKPTNLACCKVGTSDALFFEASDATGFGLWRSDGTAPGTVLVHRLDGSLTSPPVSMGGKVYFASPDTSRKVHLWRSTGVSSGLTDIMTFREVDTLHLNSTGTEIYFGAVQSIARFGVEPWKTNGTTAGTVLIKDLAPGLASSKPRDFRNFGSITLFVVSGANQLWLARTDGTYAGTTSIAALVGFPGLNTGVELGGFLYFGLGNGWTVVDLMRTDGTAAGTTRVSSVRAGTTSAISLSLMGTTIYIGVGSGLFVLSGKTITQVKSLMISSALHNLGNKLLFAARDLPTGSELWISDGTTTGTKVVKDIVPGFGSSAPSNLAVVSPNQLLFSADDGQNGRELWTSDGSAAGTRLLCDINPGFHTGSSNPAISRSIFSDGLLFYAQPNGRTYKIMVLDDTGLHSSSISYNRVWPSAGFTPFWNGTSALLFLSGTDGSTGYELWAADTSLGGAHRVKDISLGVPGSYPWPLEIVNGLFFFVADDGVIGRELWRSDGTTAGTRLVAEIRPGRSGAFSVVHKEWRAHAVLGNRLIVWANDGTHGVEPWVSDGTSAGTKLLKDIHPGSTLLPPNGPDYIRALGDRVWFMGDDRTHGAEPWITDGTTAGTQMVKDIYPGAAHSYPALFTDANGLVLFVADDGTHGREVWVSNRTAAGTKLLADILPGTGSSGISAMTSCAGRVFFAANDGVHGEELWVSDGTTAWFFDIDPGAAGSLPAAITAVGNRVYFRANDGTHGGELWVSDGTSAGTKLVCDLSPGSVGSMPGRPVLARGKLYFAATHPTWGTEPFMLLDPGAHTQRLWLGSAKAFSTLRATPPVLGKTLVLSGSSGPANYAGVLSLSLPVKAPYKVQPAGCGWLQLQTGNWSLIVLGTVQPPAFTHRLFVPNSPLLQGLQVNAQVWWARINPFTILPFEVTNGLRLVFGN